MKTKLIDHVLSILFVTLVFVILLGFGITEENGDQRKNDELIESFVKLHDVDFGNPLHKALFQETLNIFHPKNRSWNDSLLQAIDSYRMERFTNTIYKTGGNRKELSWSVLLELARMYANFIIIYLIVMVVSYYVAQTLAIYSFIKRKQQASSYLSVLFRLIQSLIANSHDQKFHWKDIGRCAILLCQALLKGMLYLILFSPAYIIAYSMKSTFETGGYIFMIILGVISNGLLINYTYKFSTFLLNESRKGYVHTAIVKGLKSSYTWNTPDGISFGSLLKLNKSYPSHVFHHIYTNAKFQYILTMKEYASFLITGLIIIEMALNIQGHLCYELLQDILYRHYGVALVIIFGIFLVVKATEILVDYWFYYESLKYENRF